MRLFNKGAKPGEKTVYKMVVDRGNGFYAWNGKLFHSDIVRACIKPRTKAIGKCVAKHLRTTYNQTEEGTKKTIETNPYNSLRFLLEEPNELMSGQVLQEKVANTLSLNGNAFILIVRDENGMPVALYPIPCESCEAKYGEAGELYIRFYFTNGRSETFPYSDLIHIRDDYFFNTVFGESPQEALTGLMDGIGAADQGLKNAVKNSAVVRWLLKFTASMRPDDLKENAKRFAEDYLSIEQGKDIGVAATDAKADAVQVTPHDYVPNAAQTDRLVQRVYAFFQTNEKIVNSLYTENEWIAYYEQAIEPIVAQMSREYTRKLFTRLERARGNEIIFESSALTFASMETKLRLGSFVDRGIMTPNEVRGYLNLAPIEGGDVVLLRKDTGKMEEREEEKSAKILP